MKLDDGEHFIGEISNDQIHCVSDLAVNFMWKNGYFEKGKGVLGTYRYEAIKEDSA